MRHRVLAQHLLGRTVMDQPAQAIVDAQQFVNAGTAAVTRMVASGAALSAKESSWSGRESKRLQLRPIGGEGLAALQAQPAHQPLRPHADQAGGCLLYTSPSP